MQSTMQVKLIAHTQLSEEFFDTLPKAVPENGQAVALTAIRTCYSPGKPSEIAQVEGDKYFGTDASDGLGGSDADRLFRHIVKSGHTSTLEHITYTFAVEGVSRSLLAQLTRHRFFSFSVQSQRYVRLGSNDKSGGFDYVLPESVAKNEQATEAFTEFMRLAQGMYDRLRSLKVTPEDARFVLPNAAATNLTMTVNLRSLLEFYGKRQKGRGAQWEIAALADLLRAEVVKVDPWAEAYFENV